jgi:hypothetical protein
MNFVNQIGILLKKNIRAELHLQSIQAGFKFSNSSITNGPIYSSIVMILMFETINIVFSKIKLD